MTSQHVEKDLKLDFLSLWADYFQVPCKDHFDVDMQANQEQDSIHNLISVLTDIFEAHPALYSEQAFPTFVECTIDIQQLVEALDQQNSLLEVFTADPQTWISSIALSLSVLHNKKKTVVRLHNVSPNNNLTSQDIGKFVAVTGTIITTGPPKLCLDRGCFNCSNCDAMEKVYVNAEGQLVAPKACKHCSSTAIRLNRNKSDVSLYQKLRVSDSNLLNIDIEIRDNLVSSFISGDKVVVHGILKTTQDELKSTLYVKYIHAYHVQHLDEQRSPDKFTKLELKQLNELKVSGELFYALIQGFCPTIYGNELVKAGILISMAGGSSGSRQNSHCLMIGDPGQGKSQLLKFANLIAPRSIFVSGTAVSQCGLTCSINKKDDDATIDAGALVMADLGICCLDEIDKMQNQHYALLEAMEQQTITLAKSAIMCQFHARTTIIATANPTNGHFQKHKTLIENIKIPVTLLSRFDLVFLLIDEPDPQRDQKLSEHIMSLHNHKRRITDFEEEKVSVQTSRIYRSLQERLQLRCQTEYQLSPAFMKKIINYVKEFKPVLTQGAAKLITEYYLKIRAQNTQAQIPITTRQLESLVRIAQGVSKLQLKSDVSEEEAQFAIDIFEESRFDCFSTCSSLMMNGKQQVNKNNVGSLSKPKQIQILLDHLHQACVTKDSFTFEYEEFKQLAKKINLQVGDMGDLIEKLNSDCLIIKRGSQTYELNYKR